MADILNVNRRTETGTLRMRRMRKAGRIPAVLYGHGEETVSLAVNARDVDTVIRHGSHIVELKGDLNESALVKDIQWDPLGIDVIHLDLTRVDATERVEVTIAIELIGVAPGTRAGGALRHSLHELAIRCPANVLPEKLEVKINDLELGQSITAGDVGIPNGAELVGQPDEIVVQCVEVVEAAEPEEEAEAAPAEPEVIGRKPDEEAPSDSE